MWIVSRYVTLWSFMLWTSMAEVPSDVPSFVPSAAESTTFQPTLPMPTFVPTITSPPSISPYPTFEPTISIAPVAPTPAPTRPEWCWDNFTILYEDLSQQPPFSSNIYTICPNRTYYIGYDDGPASCCVDGDLPLVTRSNTLIKCGDDGSSKNNCILVGGSMQVIYNNVIFDEEITNAVVQGFTFVGADKYTVLGVSPGDITFRDCIFKDQVNRGPVLAIYTPERGHTQWTRDLGESSWERLIYVLRPAYLDELKVEAPVNKRKLQGSSMMTMIFEECLFENCSQGDYADGTPTNGIITSRTALNSVIVDNCIFANNVYNGMTDFGPTGYAISVYDTDITVVNSCFINNDFAGYAPLEIFQNSAHILTNNFLSFLSAVFDTDVKCHFAAFDEGMPDGPSDDSIQCIDAGQTSCQASIFSDWLASHGGLDAASPASRSSPATLSSSPGRGDGLLGLPPSMSQPTTSEPEPTALNNKPTQTSTAVVHHHNSWQCVLVQCILFLVAFFFSKY